MWDDIGSMIEPNLHISWSCPARAWACGLGSPNGCLVDVGGSMNNKFFIFTGVSFESFHLWYMVFPNFLLLSPVNFYWQYSIFLIRECVLCSTWGSREERLITCLAKHDAAHHSLSFRPKLFKWWAIQKNVMLIYCSETYLLGVWFLEMTA